MSSDGQNFQGLEIERNSLSDAKVIKTVSYPR